MICNVFKRCSLKSQTLLAQPLKNCLNQADAHLLWVLALLRCSPGFLPFTVFGKAPRSMLMLHSKQPVQELHISSYVEHRVSRYAHYILPHTSCGAKAAQCGVSSEIGKTINKNSFHRPSLLALYHSQQNRMK